MRNTLHRTLLPLPDGWDSSVKSRQACGPVSIELLLCRLGRIPRIHHEPFSVSMTVFEIGAMLPYDMVKSLEDLGVTASITHQNSSQVSYLKDRIDQGLCSIIFTRSGLGHWLVVWGYDEDSFYCFDTSFFSTQDEQGLTRYPYSELIHIWGKLPFIVGFLLNFLAILWPRFAVRPYTSIEYRES